MTTGRLCDALAFGMAMWLLVLSLIVRCAPATLLIGIVLLYLAWEGE